MMFKTRSEGRSHLASMISVLRRAGHASYVPSGRARRAGYAARLQPVRGGLGLFVISWCEAGEFARVCATLIAAGYILNDCSPSAGDRFVEFGCAQVTPPAA